MQELRDLPADRFYTITEPEESSGKPFRDIHRDEIGEAYFARSAKVRALCWRYRKRNAGPSLLRTCR